MASLALAIVLDVYIVSDIITRSTVAALAIAGIATMGFGIVWYVVPVREDGR